MEDELNETLPKSEENMDEAEREKKKAAENEEGIDADDTEEDALEREE